MMEMHDKFKYYLKRAQRLNFALKLPFIALWKLIGFMQIYEFEYLPFVESTVQKSRHRLFSSIDEDL